MQASFVISRPSGTFTLEGAKAVAPQSIRRARRFVFSLRPPRCGQCWRDAPEDQVASAGGVWESRVSPPRVQVHVSARQSQNPNGVESRTLGSTPFRLSLDRPP